MSRLAPLGAWLLVLCPCSCRQWLRMVSFLRETFLSERQRWRRKMTQQSAQPDLPEVWEWAEYY